MRRYLIACLITLSIMLGLTPVVLAFIFTAIDFPGAVSTSASGINPPGTIVGSYTDAGGVEHGFEAF